MRTWRSLWVASFGAAHLGSWDRIFHRDLASLILLSSLASESLSSQPWDHMCLSPCLTWVQNLEHSPSSMCGQHYTRWAIPTGPNTDFDRQFDTVAEVASEKHVYELPALSALTAYWHSLVCPYHAQGLTLEMVMAQWMTAFAAMTWIQPLEPSRDRNRTDSHKLLSVPSSPWNKQR